MTAFAGSPEPEASIARRGGLLSRPKRRHTAECVARVWKCRERGPRWRRWSRGATRSRRRARSRTTRYARERCRGRRGPARRAPPPSSRQRIIPLGRTRADSRPRPSRADTPPPRERPQVIRDPFEKPLPTRDELPYWSMREVLPELLETEETAVRPRAIVRPAPRTARSGQSRPSRLSRPRSARFRDARRERRERCLSRTARASKRAPTSR